MVIKNIEQNNKYEIWQYAFFLVDRTILSQVILHVLCVFVSLCIWLQKTGELEKSHQRDKVI